MASKSLHDSQRDAVNEILSVLDGTRPSKFKNVPISKSQRCVIGYGGTGCGKTLIASVACIESTANRVLVIVPPCGGVVFDQWIEELSGLGAKNSTILYHKDGREKNLAIWREKADADETAETTHFVVTSIQTLHADACKLLQVQNEKNATLASIVESESSCTKKGKKRYSEIEWKWAFRTAASKLGKFDMLVIDEFQEFRNGSPPNDECKAIDPTKSYYASLDAVAAHSHPLIMGLSATPVVNSSGEIYSLLRLALPAGVHEQDAKLAIMEKTRRDTNPAISSLFTRQSKTIRSQNIVAIKAPDAAETTYVDVSHTYTDDEKATLVIDYGNLANIALQFLTALIAFLECPEIPGRRTNKDILKNRFLSALTHSKRLTISPESFKIPRERADPIIDPALDSNGQVIMIKNEQGQRVPLGRLLPFDVKLAHQTVPIEHISKFSALIVDLKNNVKCRSLIISEFTDVIELLGLYLIDAFPGRQIYKFHGGVSGRDRQLAAFKEAKPDAILLATRGSMGMAVNVEPVTLIDGMPHAVVQYQLDLPMSQSAQQQTEGRTKRPIAQAGVEKWIVKKVLAKVDFKTIEDWLAEVIALKNARCADMLTDKDEEALDQRQTHMDTDDGVDGPLKLLIKLLGDFLPPKDNNKERKKRKRKE